jgi:hypothetical protein
LPMRTRSFWSDGGGVETGAAWGGGGGLFLFLQAYMTS